VAGEEEAGRAVPHVALVLLGIKLLLACLAASPSQRLLISCFVSPCAR